MLKKKKATFLFTTCGEKKLGVETGKCKKKAGSGDWEMQKKRLGVETGKCKKKAGSGDWEMRKKAGNGDWE